MPLGLYTTQLNFETKSEIGQEGRNSKVFLAHDKQLDGEIVVKRIEKSKIPNASDYYNEAKVLYNSLHNNIVRVNYGYSDNDYIYIAMPFYKNGSLKKIIDQRFLTVREIIRYSIQFLSGLNHIHTKGLIHFDVKPDNILISDNNEALLSDFGLSKAMNTLGFAQQGFVYPKQIPPEKFSQTHFSIHYDIFLCGLTIYRMCNGNKNYNNQFTFKTEQEYIDAIIAGRFPDKNFYLPHIPKKLRSIINNCLEVNPTDRYSNSLELVNELGKIDKNLDWLFEPNSSGDKWTLDNDDKFYTLSLTRNRNGSFDILTQKTMKSSSRTTKITDKCSNNIEEKLLNKELEKIFKSV